MDKLELLANKAVNIIEEEYDKVRLDENESKDWVFVLETLLKHVNEEEDDTPLGIWTSIVTMLTAEYNAYKGNEYEDEDEDIVNKIENLYSKITKIATSLGF